jgi:hypothetical protein
MKLIGEYVVRGMITSGAQTEGTVMINLFRGDYKTAYKVVEFIIGPSDVGDDATTIRGFSGLLATKDFGQFSWDWGDVQQFAWASANFDINATGQGIWDYNSLIDSENLLVEDMYVHINEYGESPGNYYIKLEKYSLTEIEAAAIQVKNASQNVIGN